MRIWITGVSGLLGLHAAWEALHQGWEVVGTAYRHPLEAAPFPVLQGDLTDPAFVEKAWQWAKPDLVFHTAALAHVDACEKAPDLAFRLNAWLPEILAARAAREGIPFVHISTDAVFDGARGDYTEDDPPRPVSVYGQSKRAGEEAVLAVNPNALVVRVNFFGWSLSGRRSLAEWFLNRLQAGDEAIPGFADVWFCPLLANHLAQWLFLMVRRGLRGLYHVVALRCLTKYEFGRRVARLFGHDPERIRPVSVEEAGLAARRAHRLTLRVDKLTHDLGFPPPTPEEGLRAWFLQAQWGYPERLRGWATSSGGTSLQSQNPPAPQP